MNGSVVKKFLFRIILCALLTPACYVQPQNRQEDEKNYLSVSVAAFDILHAENSELEGRVEFRFYSIPWIIKPLSGFMTNSCGAIYLYAGLLAVIPVASVLYITPSFAPGFYYLYHCKDLGSELEFRSQLELSVKLENNLRFGLSFSHVSNATLGRINPGVESFALSVQFPL